MSAQLNMARTKARHPIQPRPPSLKQWESDPAAARMMADGDLPPGVRAPSVVPPHVVPPEMPGLSGVNEFEVFTTEAEDAAKTEESLEGAARFHRDRARGRRCESNRIQLQGG